MYKMFILYKLYTYVRGLSIIKMLI